MHPKAWILSAAFTLLSSAGLAAEAPACDHEDRHVLVVKQDDSVVRGLLVTCTDTQLELVQGDRLLRVDRSEVRKVMVDPTATPVEAPSAQAVEPRVQGPTASDVRLSRTLALTAGFILPGLGQIPTGKTELAAGLIAGTLLGHGILWGGVGFSLGTGDKSESEAGAALAVAGGVVILTCYIVGVADAFLTDPVEGESASLALWEDGPELVSGPGLLNFSF